MLAHLIYDNLNLGSGGYAPFSDSEFMGAISGFLLALSYEFYLTFHSRGTR
jgi:hypothetical protein